MKTEGKEGGRRLGIRKVGEVAIWIYAIKWI